MQVYPRDVSGRGPRRIAWLGSAPADRGGVEFTGVQLILALADAGWEVDCYHAGSDVEVAPVLVHHPRVRIFNEPTSFNWGRWYSRYNVVGFILGHLATLRAQSRLARQLRRRHQADPYDLVYQFVQTELLALRRVLADLPPLVLHPGSHSGGELRWHRIEAPLVRPFQPLWTRFATRAMLTARAWVQRRDMRLASLVIAISEHFAEDLARDYGVDRKRLAVVRLPINLERYHPADAAPPTSVVKLVYPSRLSLRKGVEMVCELSRRLVDLEGSVEILVVGDRSPWSDYRPLLAGLHPKIGKTMEVASSAMPDLYRECHGLLQPSHYEPFGLTLGEALACGLPVVASDVVGAAEHVDPGCVTVFPAGDAAAFEAAVRDLVDRLQNGDLEAGRRAARAEAERLFSPAVVTRELTNRLAGLVDGSPAGTAGTRAESEGVSLPRG